METSKKYQPLARKIRAGKSFDVAAVECGIPEDEWELARKSVQGRLPALQTSDLALHRLAMDSIKAGVKKLKELAEEGQRENYAGQTGRDVDYLAAKALLDAGIKLRGTISASVEPVTETGKRDIFDLRGSIEVKGPWLLKDPGV